MNGWHIVWYYAKRYGYHSIEHRTAIAQYGRL